MYYLSREFLKLAVISSAYFTILVLVVGWPASGVLAIGSALAIAAQWKARRWVTLGSARWADDQDLRSAGMLRSASGLVLGRINCGLRKGEAVRWLFQRRISAKEACERFWSLFRRTRTEVVRAAQAIHTAVFAPSGAGKGVSCIVPFLLECDESCVVVDFKGENALLTAKHRREQFGHRVVTLDPFGVYTRRSDSFNPLDCIDAEGGQAIDDCNDLAKALVVRNAEEKEPHWNDSAELWIAAQIATVVRYGERDGMRSLQTVREILSDPERIELANKLMRESDAWNGMLSRMGGQLSHYLDREKSSTLSTVTRHLKFLDTPAVSAITQSSSFNPADLLTGKMTIYLILPPEHFRAQSALLRLWIGSLLRAVIRGGLQTKKKVHFILDEAASLGSLEAIDDAVDKYRGYGIRMQFYYQSIGQLKKCFPNGQDLTLLSNTTQTYFGVNEMQTAEIVSSRLGDQTIVVESGGTSAGASHQRSFGGHSQESSSYSHNSNSNWQQQARRLLKPEEVIGLPPRVAITFTPGVPPICTNLVRYYEEPGWGVRPSRFGSVKKSFAVFAASAALCALAVGMAFLATKAIFAAHL
jgi:type IV secretion system protein VirD4